MSLTEEELKEFSELLSQDLENGEIEKVVSLFQYNKALVATLATLISEGNMFVRLGVNLLLEDLNERQPLNAMAALPVLIPLLKNDNPTTRGDVADIIGIIGGQDEIDVLQPLLEDEHSQVREIVAEAIDSLREKSK